MKSPTIVATSKLANKDYARIQSGYNNAVVGMQIQSLKREQARLSQPQPQDPMANVDFETLAKANPAGAFQRANGRAPKPEELQVFQTRMFPPEPPKPVSGQEVIDKINSLLQ